MKRRTTTAGRQAGFTLLECMIALSMIGLVLVNITMVVRATSKAYDSDSARSGLEAQATQMLDRVSLALAGASLDGLDPSLGSPGHSSEVNFETSLGVEDGEQVWSPPERIALEADQGQLVWKQNPGTENERRLVWGRNLRPWMLGEDDNGADDNENDLIDERGLSFVIDGESVRILLSLERMGQGGELLEYQVETRVTPRNKGVGLP